MRSIFFVFLLLLCYPTLSKTEEVKTFLKELSVEQKTSLEGLFRWLVQSVNGFVLYGDKPMGLSSYYNCTGCEPDASERSVMLVKGKRIFQDLNVFAGNKEYINLIFNANSYCNFVCINRKAFIRAVNENLSLFRYVLGPLLTAESLLKELIASGDHSYDVLKNDNALLGILLGYGTQNALLVSRQELIGCDSIHDQNEEFPFISIKKEWKVLRFQNCGPKALLLGFSTVSEELESIGSRLGLSHSNRPMIDPCQIPFFGCELASKETQDLLSTYKANQIQVIKVLDDEDFLEQTLAKFCTTINGAIEIPPVPKKWKTSLPDNKEEMIKKIAEIVRVHVMMREDRCEQSALKAFLQGVVESEKGKQKTFQPYCWGDAYQLKRELVCSEKLRLANAYFNRLSQSKEGVNLIPQGVYYKVLKNGIGLSASSKLKNVSFHYSYRFLGEKKIENIGTIKDEDVEQFIPGLLHALVGMKRGEERRICIHPRYAYGLDALHTPNATIIAKVQLIDFKEGEQEMAISPPYQLELKDTAELLAKFQELKVAEYYEQGRHFWDSMKKNGEFVDFQIFQKCMKEVMSTDYISFESLEELQQFGVDLQCHIASLSEEGG